MNIKRIHAQLMRSKNSVKRILPHVAVPSGMKETAVKKIIPTTMLVAESLTSLSGHAANVNKAMPAYGNWMDFGKMITNFMPPMPKVKEEELPLPLGMKFFTPKNKFNKNSLCLREKYNGTAEELDYFIEKLIPARQGKKDYNPFFKKGKSFIEIGEKHKINPTVLIAIAMQESGRGTSLAAVKKKNIGGIYLNNKHAAFKNVEDCIEKMAQTIDKRLKENYTTIDAIGKSGKYCEKSVSDLWVKNVVYFLNKM